MKRALIIGATGGIGAALAAHHEAQGWEVSRLSRSADGLDITVEDSVIAAAASVDGEFDQIIDATGALEIDGVGPERALKRLDPEVMMQAFRVNVVGPTLLFKHFAGRLPRERRAVFATLSARLASIGDNRLGGWWSYRASKSALNQVVRCAAIELGRKRPSSIVVALHPGTIDTALTRAYAKGRFTDSPEACAANLHRVLQRLTPAQTGGFFAYDGSVIPW